MLRFVAVGNRFMKDDGIAIAVAEALKEKLEEMGLEVIICETDCQRCFYLLDRDDFVMILDALNIGKEPGSVHVLRLQEVLAQSVQISAQHDMNIIDLMRLHNRAYKGYIIGIEVADVEFGNELSPLLSEKFSVICSDIENLIIKILVEEPKNA